MASGPGALVDTSALLDPGFLPTRKSGNASGNPNQLTLSEGDDNAASPESKPPLLTDVVGSLLRDNPDLTRQEVAHRLERLGWDFDGKNPSHAVSMAFANLARGRGGVPVGGTSALETARQVAVDAARRGGGWIRSGDLTAALKSEGLHSGFTQSRILNGDDFEKTEKGLYRLKT